MIEVLANGKVFKNGNEIKPFIRADKGTLVIRINGKRHGLAKLIATNHVKNPNNYKNVIFKDRNKLNCKASNLFWLDNKHYYIYCGLCYIDFSKCAGRNKIQGNREISYAITDFAPLKEYYKTLDDIHLLKSWKYILSSLPIFKDKRVIHLVEEYYIDRCKRFSFYGSKKTISKMLKLYTRTATRNLKKDLGEWYAPKTVEFLDEIKH